MGCSLPAREYSSKGVVISAIKTIEKVDGGVNSFEDKEEI